MPSIFGRAIIETPTNKSGGALAKGDVVVIDTANDYAVTTTTTGATTVTVGVVVEENGIANNATGRVQFGGYVGLVNVNASVTRGHYGTTHTVAKQATDGGASRIVGAFCVFLTGGTTPTAHLFVQPDASSASGNVATDAIWDAAGDLVQGTGANTAAKLSAGTAGQFLKSAGAAAANLWAFPPGYELDYVEITTGVNLTNTTEGTAHTCITGTSKSYAAVPTLISVFCPRLTVASASTVVVLLFDGATVLGRLGLANLAGIEPFFGQYRLTPTAATHQYIVKAYTTANASVFDCGAGGTGVELPAFIRVTLV